MKSNPPTSPKPYITVRWIAPIGREESEPYLDHKTAGSGRVKRRIRMQSNGHRKESAPFQHRRQFLFGTKAIKFGAEFKEPRHRNIQPAAIQQSRGKRTQLDITMRMSQRVAVVVGHPEQLKTSFGAGVELRSEKALM